jgi:hypothetical protein
MYTLAISLVYGVDQLLRRAIRATEKLIDQLLAVFVEKVECV